LVILNSAGEKKESFPGMAQIIAEKESFPQMAQRGAEKKN